MQLRSSKSALAKAVDYLAVQDYTVKQINDKLQRCKYSQEEIDNAIAKLLARHYLDDERLCQRYWQFYLSMQKYSQMQIRAKMLKKGFTGDMISRWTPEDLSEQEEKAVYNVASARYRNGIDRQKFMQYLYRKGFSSSSIQHAVHRVFTEHAEDSDVSMD